MEFTTRTQVLQPFQMPVKFGVQPILYPSMKKPILNLVTIAEIRYKRTGSAQHYLYNNYQWRKYHVA